MRARIDRYRKLKPAPHEDPDIGCIVLLQPFFLKRPDWIPVPEWRREIGRGKMVDLTTEPWQSVWERIQAAGLALGQQESGAVDLMGSGSFQEKVCRESGRSSTTAQTTSVANSPGFGMGYGHRATLAGVLLQGVRKSRLAGIHADTQNPRAKLVWHILIALLDPNAEQ